MSASFEKSHVVLLSANDPRIQDSDTIMSLEELYRIILNRLPEDLHKVRDTKEVKDRHRSFIEIKQDLEELVKYYPDYVAYTVFENGFKPKGIFVAADKETLKGKDEL